VPTLQTILLTPVSAHTLALRPLVLPATSVVTIRGSDGPDELLVTVDGQVGCTFGAGDTLVIERSTAPVPIVRFPETSFFSTMREKLHWGGLLDRDERTLADADFTRQLHEFFGQMQSAAKPERVTVAYDHRNDLDLLGIALEGFDSPETPPRPAFGTLDLNTLGAGYQGAIEAIFANDATLRARRHHALVDARVNRDGYLQLTKTPPEPEETTS